MAAAWKKKQDGTISEQRNPDHVWPYHNADGAEAGAVGHQIKYGDVPLPHGVFHFKGQMLVYGIFQGNQHPFDVGGGDPLAKRASTAQARNLHQDLAVVLDHELQHILLLLPFCS